MKRHVPIRRPTCFSCGAVMQQAGTGLRCPWAKAASGDCGWPKGRERVATPGAWTSPTGVWR